MNLQQMTLQVYRVLIRAFPREFRDFHEADLAGTAEEVVRDIAHRQGSRTLALMLPRLLLDLIVRLAVEHLRDARRDAQYALRLLARAPGFTLAAVLCLAIGTGLTAAMYAQVQSTVLADLPGAIRNPEALIRTHQPVSFPTYEELREGTPTFARLAAYMGPVPATLEVDDQGQRHRVWGQLATPNYFDVLGVRASTGRLFGADEETEGSTSVVLGERLWRTRFGANPAVVGESLRVNGQLLTIIGVAPPGFAGASPMTAACDLWIPTTTSTQIAPELHARRDRLLPALHVVARLEPGVSADQAELALDTVARRLEQVHGDAERATTESRIRVLPGGRMFPVRDEDLPRAIGFPLVLVSLVLLMACGNVANMMLARGAIRYREFAVRLALGAGRGRVVRQLVTESLILSALGSAAGGVMAIWLLSLFDRMRPVFPDYVQYNVRFHWPAYLAAVLVASLSTVLFSMAPSLRASRLDIQTALKPNGPSALRGRRRFGVRNLIIYQQVSISVVLILLTGFVVVGWRRAATVDLGFNPTQLYLLSVDPIRDGFSPAQAEQVIRRLRESLQYAPAVDSVSVAQTVPLAMAGADLVVNARSDLAAGTRSLGTMRVDRVGAGFFETVETALLQGRTFREADQTDDGRVVIVNRTMAQRAWPGSDPVGQPLKLGDDTWEIIGVVNDMRSAFPLAPTLPAVYQPVTPAGFASPGKNGVTLAVRVPPGVDGSALLLSEVRAAAPDLTVVEIKPVTREVDQALFLARVATYVYGGMGVLALVLAAVGLAGVTAYAVARRTREIGIRMALGAKRAHVLWLVLRESVGIILAGTVTGVILAIALTRALSGVVEALAETTGTSVSDPLLLLGAPTLLVVLALIACYLPARRSTQIDPIAAVRSE
jgi:macrolide transport system ATP-binding/permease protein